MLQLSGVLTGFLRYAMRSGKARALRSRVEEERPSSLRSTTSTQSKLLQLPPVPPLFHHLARPTPEPLPLCHCPFPRSSLISRGQGVGAALARDCIQSVTDDDLEEHRKCIDLGIGFEQSPSTSPPPHPAFSGPRSGVRSR
jgi:hypothetical protein